jgi:exodeoxyribonuclease III
MRLLTWNIRHGGKNNNERIIDTLIGHDADLIVITEYREEHGERIKKILYENGWKNQLSSEPPVKTNGILVLSKYEISKAEIGYKMPEAGHRWLDFCFKDFDLEVLAIHIPNFTDKWGKEEFWKAVVDFARGKDDENVIIMGDFNTGLKIDAEGVPFKQGEYMEELNRLGWIDAWRYLHPEVKEFTWYSSAGNGFRLDYAYLAPGLKEKLVGARHSHGERVEGVSDHSGLVVEVVSIVRTKI